MTRILLVLALLCAVPREPRPEPFPKLPAVVEVERCK